jgi:hypothetical protein
MKRSLFFALMIYPTIWALAQEAPSSSSSQPPMGDVEALRQEVRALTDTVKSLQQQVKDQQAALEKANLTPAPQLPQNPVPPAGAESSQAKATPPPLIPTEDTSVVAGGGPHSSAQ